MTRVYISLGSNIDREQNIRGAVRALKEHYGRLLLSRVYETPAEGFDGDAFYNLVAGFDTEESVEQVRSALAAIEATHGRTRNGPRSGPRTLDLDLLLYGGLVRHGGGFDLPRGERIARTIRAGLGRRLRRRRLSERGDHAGPRTAHSGQRSSARRSAHPRCSPAR